MEEDDPTDYAGGRTGDESDDDEVAAERTRGREEDDDNDDRIEDADEDAKPRFKSRKEKKEEKLALKRKRQELEEGKNCRTVFVGNLPSTCEPRVREGSVLPVLQHL